MKPVSPLATLISDEAYLDGSFQLQEQPDRRKSRVWTFFAPRSPLAKIDDTDNYRSSDLVLNAESEANYEAPAIDKILSRWIPEGGREVASKLGDVILSRLARPPRRFNFKLWKTHLPVPQLGAGYRLSAPTIQDDTGAQDIVPVIITRLDPNETEYAIEAEESYGGAEPVDLLNRLITIETDTYNLNIKTLHDSIYQPLTDQDVLDGVSLTVRVNEGVRVGSILTSLYAMDFGDEDDWPEGLPIILEVRGLLAGRGGNSRRGAIFNANGHLIALAGLPGGPALRTRFPIKIMVKEGGKIGGGGGGGGGGAANVNFISRGGGGGGGAGFDPGLCEDTSRPGDPGTDIEGGDGRNGSGGAGRGGDGGDLGQPGNQGFGAPGNAGGLGGAAGPAIDGISYCTIEEGDADILGPRIN